MGRTVFKFFPCLTPPSQFTTYSKYPKCLPLVCGIYNLVSWYLFPFGWWSCVLVPFLRPVKVAADLNPVWMSDIFPRVIKIYSDYSLHVANTLAVNIQLSDWSHVVLTVLYSILSRNNLKRPTKLSQAKSWIHNLHIHAAVLQGCLHAILVTHA